MILLGGLFSLGALGIGAWRGMRDGERASRRRPSPRAALGMLPAYRRGRGDEYEYEGRA